MCRGVSITDTPDNPWKFQNSSLFTRLDAFMERCHDMMDMMSTCVQFNKLERIEIGGTKGGFASLSDGMHPSDLWGASGVLHYEVTLQGGCWGLLRWGSMLCRMGAPRLCPWLMPSCCSACFNNAGKVLTNGVKAIHTDFVEAVERFQGVSYDVMDTDAKEFDQVRLHACLQTLAQTLTI